MAKRGLILFLVLSMSLSLIGCGGVISGNSELLTKKMTPAVLDIAYETPGFDGAAAIADFTLHLMQDRSGEGSTLLSPVSVLYALAMTMNGAEGGTLTQMESALGMRRNDLNVFLTTYLHSLPQSKDAALHMANSLWMRDEADRLNVRPEFLQANVDYYDAEIFSAPFDASTVKDINAWANKHTDGMIPQVLDKIPDAAVMYLINALSFDAKWQRVYEESQVREDTFTTESGQTQKCELMWSGESEYLEDTHATGFLKYYRDGYAFAALLPEPGMPVAEYLATLSGAALHELLTNPQEAEVTAAIPKFTCEYADELSEVLAGMGIEDLFDADKCDLTGLGTSTEGNIFVSRVIHKAFIQVDEQGTRAGAVTAVEAGAGDSPVEEIKEVILDRPFVFLLVDTQTMTPLFIGTYMGE